MSSSTYSVAPLPTPVELGFAPKFTHWREPQIRALDLTIASKKRFIGIVAPCGFGKALYGMSVTRLSPGVDRSIYLTSTRGLQYQAVVDFGNLGLRDVKGQQNYPCIALDPGSNLARYRNRRRQYAGCDEGPCHVGVTCYHAPDPRRPHEEPYCKYYNAVWHARKPETPLVNTNYAYWLTSATYGQGLGEFDLMVGDEAHTIVEELERFLVFELTPEEAVILNTKLPAPTTPDAWIAWATTHHTRLTDRLTFLDKTKVPGTADEAHDRKRLKALQSKLDRLRLITNPDEWIVERDERRHHVRFSPLNVSQYAETYLFHGTQKIVLMSATLTAKTMDMLGISPDDRELIEFPSTFPVARRPGFAFDLAIGVVVNAGMSQQQMDLWVERIDRLIDDRVDLKGIVHCVSYERGKYLYDHSRHHELMIFHDKQTTQTAVDAFKLHHGGAVLVSPSIMTGFDFPYDECRYQIIGKVPIPDPRGPIMQARIKADPDYSWYVAMQKLEQAVGRGMRAEDDWCETFIVDDTFGNWFLWKARRFATSHFLESIRTVSAFPVPLSLTT